MRLKAFLSLLLLCVVLSVRPVDAQDGVATTVVAVQDSVWLYDVKRLGINVGAPDQFGAGQYLKNVIANPGFEAGEFATLFLTAADGSAEKIQQDNWQTEWNVGTIGQPPGYWNGAEYEFLSGPMAGSTGEVSSFTHENGLYTYYLDRDKEDTEVAVSPSAENVVILRKPIPGYDADQNPTNRADPTQTRPNSIGRQSLQLLPTEADWQPSFTYYMDSYWRDGDTSAGKLILIQGNWHFEVWAKGSRAGDVVEVVFQRQGQEPFLSEQLVLSDDWQPYRYNFFVPQGADALIWEDNGTNNPVLEFSMRILPDGGDVWIDDIGLYRTDYQNPTVFTDKYINLLRQYNPGIVRNWGGQLGSSLDNQLSLPWARRPTAHSPRQQTATTFHYSLHEFLELAQELDAEPWYVIPPTFSAEELKGLISYLSAPAGTDEWADRRAYLGQIRPWTDVFPTIHLEFGNEMWGGNDGGDPFIGATLRGGERLGAIAGERIGIMKESEWFSAASTSSGQTEKLNFIVGGQHNYALRQEQIEENSISHDTIALAPYFGELDVFNNDAEIFYPLFARPYQDVRVGSIIDSVQSVNRLGQNTDFAIYEINFHTTEGNAPLSIRNGFVTGLNGGLALPLYMLSYQKGLGIKNQAAFGALQFSFRMNNGEYARVWGMLRDLEATGRKRPTWLGAELANRAIQGDMLVTAHSGDDPRWQQDPINGITQYLEVPYIQSFAFRDGESYGVVLFNLHLEAEQRVILETPQQPDSTAIWHKLYSDSIHHNNESAPLVNIRTNQITDFAQSYELMLPPHSMHVIQWGNQGEAPNFVTPSATPPPAKTPSPTPIVVNTPTVTPTLKTIVRSDLVTQTVILSATQTATPVIVAGGVTPTATQQFALIGDAELPEPSGLMAPLDNAVGSNRNLLLIVSVVGLANLLVIIVATTLIVRQRRA